jgi:hypothetical protein
LSRIRPFRAEDLPAIAALWLRAFRRSGSPASVERYLREVFLARDDDDAARGAETASLVAEDAAGDVVGFVGGMPRRMVFRGRPIRAVVTTQLMVDPDRRRGLVAFDLLRSLFAGPQALTFCDGANDRSQQVWERSGGEVARLYSLDWIRVLRPAGYVRYRLARAGRDAAPSVSAPLARAADALAGSLVALEGAAAIGVPLGRPRARLADEALSCAAVCAILDATLPAPSLRARYDAASLAWLLDQAARTRGHGPLRSRLCRNAAGEAVGWYVYYAKPEGLAQVLQIGGKHGAIGDVLASLFADAYAAETVAVVGQAEPRWLREITDAHATFACHSLGVLIHAKDREIASAVQRGDSLLSRLDGEWWLRFAADPLVD